MFCALSFSLAFRTVSHSELSFYCWDLLASSQQHLFLTFTTPNYDLFSDSSTLCGLHFLLSLIFLQNEKERTSFHAAGAVKPFYANQWFTPHAKLVILLDACGTVKPFNGYLKEYNIQCSIKSQGQNSDRALPYTLTSLKDIKLNLYLR